MYQFFLYKKYPIFFYGKCTHLLCSVVAYDLYLLIPLLRLKVHFNVKSNCGECCGISNLFIFPSEYEEGWTHSFSITSFAHWILLMNSFRTWRPKSVAYTCWMPKMLRNYNSVSFRRSSNNRRSWRRKRVAVMSMNLWSHVKLSIEFDLDTTNVRYVSFLFEKCSNLAITIPLKQPTPTYLFLFDNTAIPFTLNNNNLSVVQRKSLISLSQRGNLAEVRTFYFSDFDED